MRFRPAGALELPRRAGAGGQQRRTERGARAAVNAPLAVADLRTAGGGRMATRWLGRVPYVPTWRAMQRFTEQRSAATPDEIWLLEHEPVFTRSEEHTS